MEDCCHSLQEQARFLACALLCRLLRNAKVQCTWFNKQGNLCEH